MKVKVSALIPHQIPHDQWNLNEESLGATGSPQGGMEARLEQ